MNIQVEQIDSHHILFTELQKEGESDNGNISTPNTNFAAHSGDNLLESFNLRECESPSPDSRIEVEHTDECMVGSPDVSAKPSKNPGLGGLPVMSRTLPTTASERVKILHTCKDCGAKYTTFKKLVLHKRRNHGLTGGNILRCSECGIIFYKPSEIRRHLFRSHGVQASKESINGMKLSKVLPQF